MAPSAAAPWNTVLRLLQKVVLARSRPVTVNTGRRPAQLRTASRRRLSGRRARSLARSPGLSGAGSRWAASQKKVSSSGV